jgi:hypothetical protein
MKILFGVMFLILLPIASIAQNATMASFTFDGSMSRHILESYYSRAVSHVGLCASSPETSTPCLNDDIRMLKAIGAKFVGRAAYCWDIPQDNDAHFRQASEAAAAVHKADPEIILQACIFEAIYKDVNKIPVPDWVFTEFGLTPEKRNFNYDAMLYNDGMFRDHWMTDASVPDMSKIETKMWFFYRARRYIDAGFEAIHFGQVHLMDKNDPDHRNWLEMLTHVRRYAAVKARRHFVLCDAHTHGVIVDGVSLFDANAWPLRPVEISLRPQHVELISGSGDSIFGRSLGGKTPSGWICGSLPYLVEFDSWGSTGKGGNLGPGMPWLWGYDEICWFSHQEQNYRDAFLRYAWNWVRNEDANGWLEMPTRRNLADPVENGSVNMYQANNKSQACPKGFNQENIIKYVWDHPGR